jgi:membrane protein
MSRISSLAHRFFQRHRLLKSFIDKLMKDNIGLLASVISWSFLTSAVAIVIGLVALTSLFLQSPGAQSSVIDHLSAALQGTFTRQEIQDAVKATVQNNGLLGIIGFAGIIWGGSNVGGAISTVFQPIFRVGGRSFLREKVIDVSMILLLTALLIIVVFSTTAIAFLDRLISSHVPPMNGFLLGTLVSLLAAFLLFASVYLVFPNVDRKFTARHIWSGAVTSAVLFQALTYIFPLYTSVAHLQRYGAVLGAVLLLTAWIYFFSLILLFGAEIVAFNSLLRVRPEGQPIGPIPDGTVPQHAEQRHAS